LPDELVERRDDVVLQAAGLRTGPALTEPAGDVAHPARGMVERVGLEGREVGLQQPGEPLVAGGDRAGPLEQRVERVAGRLGLEQPVLARGAMEEQRRRIDRRGDGDGRQVRQRLVEAIVSRELAAEPEFDGVALEGGHGGLVEPGGRAVAVGFDVAPQAAHPGVAELHDGHRRVDHVAAPGQGGVPRRHGRGHQRRGDAFDPGERSLPHFRGSRLGPRRGARERGIGAGGDGGQRPRHQQQACQPYEAGHGETSGHRPRSPRPSMLHHIRRADGRSHREQGHVIPSVPRRCRERPAR
jgi:hypothetical protein